MGITRNSSGVLCRNASGLIVNCDCASPPPPPPPGSPPPCGPCDPTPPSFQVVFSGTTVVSGDRSLEPVESGTSRCCFLSSANYSFGQATINTADGTYCLLEQSGECRWTYKSTDPTLFWSQFPGQSTPSPCDDPPDGFTAGIEIVLFYDASSDSWGITLHLETITGPWSIGIRVFEATFDFTDCDTITVDNEITEADSCTLSEGYESWAKFGFGGTATITNVDCGGTTDICSNTGSDDCPDTVHVSATGGSFDGFDADVTRTDTSTHTWGDPGAFCSAPCAYIECIDGTLTLTLRSDVAPICTISYTADGTGACPTGRSWTLVEPVPEGCTAPDSVSVT